VTKDIKSYSINYGSPCKFSKYRFDKNELTKKLKEAGYDDKRINDLISD